MCLISKSSNRIDFCYLFGEMNNFICDLCGAKFQLKVEIIIHLKDHQSELVQKSMRKKSVKGKYLKMVCYLAAFVFK